MKKIVTVIYIFILFNIQCLVAQIEATVYWNTPKGRSAEKLLGITVRKGVNPQVAGDYNYQDQIKEIAPQFIRLYAAETLLDSRKYEQGWVLTAEKKWDAEKIRAVLSAFPVHYRKQMLLTIAGWPSWMDRDNDSMLDADQTDAYANWCARLVKIVNIEQGWDIPYWSPFNEAEGKIANGAEGLADLFSKCAIAMKRADPSIKVGGGEFKSGWDNELLDSFIINTSGRLDFFSYHHYIGAEKNVSDSDIINGISALAGLGSSIRDKLNQFGLQSIPLWITEYNVFRPGEPEQPQIFSRSAQNAVFHALTLKHLAERGKVNGCSLWNDCNEQLAVMDENYKLHPAARLLALKNRYMVGIPVKVTSKKPAVVNLFAVEFNGGKSVLLINQSPDLQSVDLVFDGWRLDNNEYDLFTITADKYDSTTQLPGMNFGKSLLMPGYSLLMFSFKALPSLVEEESPLEIPANCELSPAFPNPFNSTSVIQFSVVESQNVKLLLFNARGQLLQEIYQGWAEGDLTYTASIDGSKLASGQYQVYLMGDDISATRSLTLLR